MSDHEGSKPVQGHDVDDVVDSAKEGLADAMAAGAAPAEEADAASVGAGADAPPAAPQDPKREPSAESPLAKSSKAADAPKAEAPEADASEARTSSKEDQDLKAFADAEAAYPGTFGGTFTAPPPAPKPAAVVPDPIPEHAPEPQVATVAYAPPAADLAETRVVPSEPVIPADPAAQLPIFVQAPEAPRPRGNRGSIAGIGLLAALVFAVLYLGASLGFGALEGSVTFDNIGTVALEHLRGWGLWVTTAVFFIGFWLLGALVNRGRWGFWVIFGIFVGAVAYGGHILGALFDAPFWTLTSVQAAETVEGQVLAPLAITAFILGRELTMWFGAWASRSGARKNERNAEDRAEYERLLEAGPQLQD